MSEHDNDFPDHSLEMPEFEHDGQDEHYPDGEDAADEAPPTTSKKKGKKGKKSQSSGNSGIMKIAIPAVAAIVIAGGGYVGYSYYQSTTSMSHPIVHHAQHGDFPVRSGGLGSGNLPGQNNLPPASANPVRTPGPAFTPPQPQAPQQAQQLTPPPALNLPQTQTAPAPVAPPVNAPQMNLPRQSGTNEAQLLPPASNDSSPQLGFTQKPATPSVTTPVPATPPAPAASESMMDVLNTLKDNETHTTDAITKGADSVKTEVDQRADILSSKLDELTAKTEQLSKQIDGLHLPAATPPSSDAANSAPAPALHIPKKRILHKVVRPKKVVEHKVEPSTDNISAWHLRGTSKDFVVLQDASGKYRVAKIGSDVPGAGRINGLVKNGNGTWVVQTSQGTIQE